jgi:hypothetical protein
MGAAKDLFISTGEEKEPQLIDIKDTHTDELVMGLCGPIGSGWAAPGKL